MSVANSLVAGLLLAIAWAFLPELAVLACALFLFALHTAKKNHALLCGAVFGLAQSLVLGGIALAGWKLYAAIALMCALSALSVAAVSRALAVLPHSAFYPWLTAAIWVSVDFVHELIPFTAPNIVGHMQWRGLLLQLARWGGGHACTFGVILAAAAMVSAVCQRSVRPMVAPLVTIAILSASSWAFLPSATGIRSVNIIQGGIPTWAYAKAEQPGPWGVMPEHVYSTLTRAAPRADLTIWPETAVWHMWRRDEEYMRRMRALRSDIGGPLLFGVPVFESERSYANEAVLLQGGQESSATKQRLAMLAEGGFAPGHQSTVFSIHSGDAPWQLGVVFCLESVVHRYARAVVADGAEALVFLAEGGRFGPTHVAALHARMSVVRAVETGRAVIYASQHGHSMLVTPSGDIRAGPAPSYTATALHTQVPLYAG